MVQQLLNEPDLDTILQWSVMQKFMDELSETEEEASGSSDDMAPSESLVALGILARRWKAPMHWH